MSLGKVIRTALFPVLAAAQPAGQTAGSFSYLVAPARSGNARNSEAAMVRLRNGRLLLAWTDFYTNDSRDDGRLMLWVRTSNGHPYQCYSSDAGETWSEPKSVASPLSPQSIKRIPGTRDLLMVWNNSRTERFPLTTAISSDGGRTWRHIRNLDTDPAHTYGYTSITFDGHRVLFTYYSGPPAGVKVKRFSLSLKLDSVPISWLYQ